MNIVLAHGYLGFSEFCGIEYFNGVKKRIKEDFGSSVRVFVSRVPGAASILERAESLSRQIDEALDKGLLDPGSKVHVIAHSMGGLDARCMISENLGNITPHLSSLTTISTPHLGSPIADLIISKIDGKHLSHFAAIRERLLRAAITALGIPLDGLRDLTTREAVEFNKRTPDREGVRYFHIAGKGRDGMLPTSGPLLLAHLHIKECTGEENDGLVSVSSAARGDREVEIWPADHADEIGHNLDFLHPPWRPAVFDHLSEYRKIIERLFAMENVTLATSPSRSG